MGGLFITQVTQVRVRMAVNSSRDTRNTARFWASPIPDVRKNNQITTNISHPKIETMVRITLHIRSF